MKFFSLILGNLKRKKLRTALTILSIIVAFVLFGYLSAIRAAFLAGIDVAGADRLITRNKVSLINLMPLAHQAEIERVEEPFISASIMIPERYVGAVSIHSGKVEAGG